MVWFKKIDLMENCCQISNNNKKYLRVVRMTVGLYFNTNIQLSEKEKKIQNTKIPKSSRKS
jgi:small-conductance mechanosensitive channel